MSEKGGIVWNSVNVWCRNKFRALLVWVENLYKFSCLQFGIILGHIDGILPKGPYPPCLRMVDRALLTGYPRYVNKELARGVVLINASNSKQAPPKCHQRRYQSNIVPWSLFHLKRLPVAKLAPLYGHRQLHQHKAVGCNYSSMLQRHRWFC